MSLPLAAATARLVDPILAVVFPSTCPGCHAPLLHPTRGPLCDSCWTALPRHQGRLCGCGFPLPVDAAGPCGRCRRGLTPFVAGASLGPYEGLLRTVIHELKYRGRRRLAARLAEALLARVEVRALLEGAVIVPVPLHPRKLRQRGFNQSELLGRELARLSGRRIAAQALVRRKETSAQTGLSAAARRANMSGAFAVRRRAQVAGQAIVLLDDVLTTGATARACAGTLREAGAAAVRLLTVARVA